MMVDLKGYEGKYKINESGVIINKKGHVMRTAKSKPGYLRVALEEKDSKHRKNESIHRLVAQTFIENPDPINKNIVMHLDNDKLNNHVSNLKWGTQSENVRQSMNDGLKISPPTGTRVKTLYRYDIYDQESGEEIISCYGRSALAETIQYELISLKNMVGECRPAIALGPYKGYHIKRVFEDYIKITKPIYYINESGNKYYPPFYNC